MNNVFNIILSLSGVIGVVVLFLVCTGRIRKVTRNRNDSWDKYWNEEREANMSRQAFFPTDLLLIVDWDKIPHVENKKCEMALGELLRFKDSKMVYLKGLSNTEVKKQYGINYFSQLLQYEETFYQFMKSLKAYYVLLEEEGFPLESRELKNYCNSFGYY